MELNLPYVLGDLSSIPYIWLTLTNQCNIHCTYCFNYIYKNFDNMSADLTLSIINAHLKHIKSFPQEKFNIIYFGGEPTINETALIASIDHLAEQGIPYNLNLLTNGIIKPHVLDALLKRNIEYQISFDGIKNNVRLGCNGRTDASQNTIETIKKIVKNNSPVTIRATMHHNNVENIPALITFCHEHGIKDISFAPICMFGDSILNSMRQPTVADYINNLKSAAELAYKLNINMNLKGEAFFKKLQKNKRRIPFIWLPDGKVAMSITYASSKLPGADSIIIGEYSNSTATIVLDDEKIQQMNKNFLLNRAKHCCKCPLLDTCQGLLHFTPFATDTFIEKRDNYFCQIAVEMNNAFPDTGSYL